MNRIIYPSSLCYLLLLFAVTTSFGQQQEVQSGLHEHTAVVSNFTFENQNGLLEEAGVQSFLITGVADLNGDGLDDIISLDDGRFLTIEFQQNSDMFYALEFGAVDDLAQWSLAVADVDNNGVNDLMTGGYEDQAKLLYASDNGDNFNLTVLNNSAFEIQGANFVDINQDGHTDIFICNDYGYNRHWINDGNGNFPEAVIWDDPQAMVSDSAAGNYSSIWTDFDNDNDLDLYISKCWGMANSAADYRRINQLFVNDGNNNFVESAAEYPALRIGRQSWTADFQDIDNDGDLDALIVNHYEPCQLLENTGNGQFVDITNVSNLIIENNPLQGLMRDFNNDGFVDVLVAGNEGYKFFQNNGNLTFTEIAAPFGNYQMATFAIGDLNHDGFLDIYSGSNIQNSNDVLWMNNRNNNHFFVVSLEGTTSNPNAIGSRLELYGPWGVQIREVRAGESYGIMNSFKQYFGLGGATSIDSLVVRWPSGLVESFDNPGIDRCLRIVEEECAYPDRYIYSHNKKTYCPGDSLLLVAPGGTTYEWSNGANSQEIYVSASDAYQVTVTNAWGCSTISAPLVVSEHIPEEPPVISSLNGQTTFCFGDNAMLFSSIDNNIEWSTGATTSSIVVFETDTYTVALNGECGAVESAPFTVEIVPVPAIPQAEDVIFTVAPSEVTLTANGNNLFWYDLPGGELLATGNTFTTAPLFESTTFYVRDVNETPAISCESSFASVEAIFDSLTSITPLPELGLSVFPNPARSFVLLSSESTLAGAVSIDLISTSGQLLRQYQLPNGLPLQWRLDLPKLSSGLYILRLQVGEDRQEMPLVISQD